MPKPKLLTLSLLAVALLVLAGGWLTLRLAYPPFVPPPLPQPNGYDDLLRAAEMLAPRTGFYKEMEPEELAAVVNDTYAASRTQPGLQRRVALDDDLFHQFFCTGSGAHQYQARHRQRDNQITVYVHDSLSLQRSSRWKPRTVRAR